MPDPTEQSRDGITTRWLRCGNRYGDEYNSAMDLTGAITLVSMAAVGFTAAAIGSATWSTTTPETSKTNVAFH